MDQLYEKEVEDRDGEPCQLCTFCLRWVPVKEKGEHYRDEHMK